MKALCDALHGMGLKAGIYSTPWITSYAKFAGGSSDDPSGRWSKDFANEPYWRHGTYSFENADAKQWATWGFDYLKYDWAPNDVSHIETMSRALRRSGRDIVFSLSNNAPFVIAADMVRLANSWRTTGDIRDVWTDPDWNGVSEIGFSQDRWSKFAGPGHWNDPDMLVVGYVGWGPQLHASRLTPNEQYTHVTMWCMLSAPLLIGCDLERLDAFTLNLLTNDEVLAVDQDALGRQAVRVATLGAVDIYLKDLEDGSKAIAFFNRDSLSQTISFKKLYALGFDSRVHVRDLWRNRDFPDLDIANGQPWDITIGAHGAELFRLSGKK
jgi:alpha-galactosidase